MKKYPEDDNNIDWKTFPFSKFKIVAETEEDKKELLEAFKHIHDSDIDTRFVTVNQLAHLYQQNCNLCYIIVDADLYSKI
jgi:hypothetical protein